MFCSLLWIRSFLDPIGYEDVNPTGSVSDRFLIFLKFQIQIQIFGPKHCSSVEQEAEKQAQTGHSSKEINKKGKIKKNRYSDCLTNIKKKLFAYRKKGEKCKQVCNVSQSKEEDIKNFKI